MKILHLSSGSLFGGVETFLVEVSRIAHSASSPGVLHEFALTEEGRFADELLATGARVHRLGRVRMRYPWELFRARRRLGGLLRSGGYDVVVTHSPWAHAAFAGTVRKAGLPLAFQLHGHVTGAHRFERIARRTPPDLVLTNSEFTASTSEKIFPGVRCEVIRYAVPEHVADFGADVRGDVRREFATSEEDVVIVQTSRMEEWKGHRLHIEGIARLADLPGWTSWFVGGVQRPEEVAYRAELEELARERGVADRIRWIGQRSDIPRILEAADIHCQPNLGPEPFGIVFVEALYAGIPVVTTALGGPKEIVTDDCGILTPPGDAEALAAALRTLIDDADLRARLGAAGPRRAAELCDPARQADRFGELLASLTNADVHADRGA